VIEDGGLLLLGLRVNDPERRFATIPGIAEQEADEVEELVRRAGFRDLRVERRAGTSSAAARDGQIHPGAALKRHRLLLHWTGLRPLIAA
jgi:hypothetical protein